MAGAGTQTAGLVFGGNPNVSLTESWNGSTWTNVGNLNLGRAEGGGAGTQTSALYFGGSIGPDNATEAWYGDGKLTDIFTTS